VCLIFYAAILSCFQAAGNTVGTYAKAHAIEKKCDGSIEAPILVRDTTPKALMVSFYHIPVIFLSLFFIFLFLPLF
jgi:hypothetical protein